MNRKDLWDALDQIDDDLLAEASRPRRKRPAWRRWGALGGMLYPCSHGNMDLGTRKGRIEPGQ